MSDNMALPSLKELKTIFYNVTNITLTGSAIINRNRRLLIQGMTTVIVVNVRALGHFVGWSASKEGFRSPRHCKQTRFGWEVEILVYSDGGRWVPGSATDRHDTIGTLWRSSSWTHIMDTWILWCTSATHTYKVLTISTLTPEIGNSH